MIELPHISSMRPEATDEELVAISTGLVAIWPKSKSQRNHDSNEKWRFSRRRWHK